MAVKPDYPNYTFMTPDEIDAIILDKLAYMPRRENSRAVGGKSNPKKVVWTESELCLRRQVITDLLCQGLSTTRTKQELMARWQVCDAAALSYIKDAIDHMASDNEVFVEKARDIMQHKLEGIAEEALAKNDRKSALNAYDMLNKINGLYKEKIEADVKTEIKFDFS